MGLCTSLALGVILSSYHFDRDKGYNEVNPGVYANCDGYTAGVYYNSERRTSVIAGYTFSLGPVDVLAGVVTGYRRGPALALLPSVKVGHVRIGLIPPVAGVDGAVTLSLEFNL